MDATLNTPFLQAATSLMREDEDMQEVWCISAAWHTFDRARLPRWGARTCAARLHMWPWRQTNKTPRFPAERTTMEAGSIIPGCADIMSWLELNGEGPLSHSLS